MIHRIADKSGDGSCKCKEFLIAVGIAGDNCVSIDLKLNILIGYRLPDVVQQVPRSVIDSIESVTGMTVTRVNVAVQDIDEQPVEEEGDETADEAAVSAGCTIPMP